LSGDTVIKFLNEIILFSIFNFRKVLVINKNSSAIQLNGVTKYYGNYPAITDISFDVSLGESVGFLGPNGAGKSTTMKIITGFMPPTSGSVSIAGYDVVSESLQARRMIGYLPETVPLYTDMVVREYLYFMGKIRGMSNSKINKRIDDVIEMCGLEIYRNSIIGKLSKGFRQRLGISQAILHEPEILVLDEPTIGIDPIQVVETRDLIKNLKGNHTLIVSTHILPEASAICDRVIIIHEGEIVAIDSPDQLGNRLRGGVLIELDIKGPRKQVVKALQNLDGVRNVMRVTGEDDGTATYSVDTDQSIDVSPKLASLIVNSGWELKKLETLGMTLEEIFLKLTTTEESIKE
jgi:ABC-2 type transport system ATP-binding protein|tara:strand:- start:25295 stop:26341 length:1047 start_codon:yes stop_codon:yes gene_type:complete